MITAHSDDVKLPPGRYQVSTVLRSLGKCKTITSKKCKSILSEKRKECLRSRQAKAYKRTRPNNKTRCEREVERYLLDAAIDDPDELHELWIRPADSDVLHE